jgi:hypothetical protein
LFYARACFYSGEKTPTPADGPYVVGVVSAEGSLDPNVTDQSIRTANWVAGGSEMPDLVNQARSENP